MMPAHTISPRFVTLNTLLVGTAVILSTVFTPSGFFPQVKAQTTEVQTQAATAPATPVLPAEVVAPSPTPSSDVTLTAIPPRYGDDGSLNLKPGEKKQIQVRVKNSSNQSVTVDSFAQDFTIDTDGVTPIPVTDAISNRWSLASWIVLSPNSRVLKAGETSVVNAVITAPADALPGGHYAMITHTPTAQKGPRAEGGELPSASVVSQRVGTLLYVKVDGPINEEAIIRGFKMPQLTEYGPVPFDFVVENLSDIHITPRISVDFYNIFGRKVDTIILESNNIFPLMNRSFSGQWNRVWGVGPYQAQITMSYGQGGQLAVAKTAFWLIPYRLILAASVIVLFILATIVLIRRHLLHRQNTDQARVALLEKRLAELESDQSTDQPTNQEN